MAKVTIEAHGGRLRLRWFYEGRRRTVACGVSDNAVGRAIAQQKAAQIELDIATGHYDATLVKYRPRILGKNRVEVSCPELFKAFADHQLKAKGLEQASISARYQPIWRSLEKWANHPAHLMSPHKAGNVAARMMETLTARTAKERLWLLESCWDWGKGRYDLGDENPWRGLAERIKTTPKQPVKPFSIGEVVAILEAFDAHPKYRHYADFVRFLVGTGRRPGEAAGLKWEHLGAGFQTAWVGESVTRGRRKGTKTGRAQTVNFNPAVQKMLSDRHARMNPLAGDLVFPAPRGGPIDDRLFRNRAWKAILAQCRIEYRKPYALRHSAGSIALANGGNPVAIAEQMGTSLRVFYATYAHEIEKKSVFQEF